MRKRSVFSIVTALVLCIVFAVQPLAFSFSGTEHYVALVNTDMSVSAWNSISASYEEAPRFSMQTGAGVYDVQQDEQGQLVQLAPDLPEAEYLGAEEPLRGDGFEPEAPRYDYQAGESTRTVKCKNRSVQQYVDYEMVCLYVGTYCTVWGTTSDNVKIRLNETNAAKIGAEFDARYPEMVTDFGNHAVDVDGDGKLAILCYDIDANYESYPNGYYGGYYAGYFWMQDLINSENKIGNLRFNSPEVTNGIDCIHIDTYPGMGNAFENVEGCYSTLIHEYQHMINFGSRLFANGMRGEMPTFLDEAFAMAAEHMIYGANGAVASRVSYFNSTSYNPGASLTMGWAPKDGGGTLDNYANSYLFGQYVRTRYAQLGKNGNTIYKQVIDTRRETNRDCMEIIADLLGQTQMQLVSDFWVALALKQPRGRYGFAGESWAKSINARLSTTGGSIHNGSARFYKVSDMPDVQPADNLTLVYFDKNGVIPYVSTTSNATTLTFTAATREEATVTVAFYDRSTNQMLFTKQYSIPVGTTSYTIKMSEDYGLTRYIAKVIMTDTAVSYPVCVASTVERPSKSGEFETPELDLG